MGWLILLGSPFVLIACLGFFALKMPIGGGRLALALGTLFVAVGYGLILFTLSVISGLADLYINLDLPTGSQHHGALTLADLCAKGFYLCLILALAALAILIQTLVGMVVRRR